MAALVLLAGLIAVAAIGIGAPHPTGPLRRGQALVAGVDVASGKTVHLNLANDVPVRVLHLPAAARRAQYVRLGFSAMGVQLPPSRSAPLTRARNGSRVAHVDASRLRVLVSGKMTAQLRFLDGYKNQLLAHDFRSASERSIFLTANGLIGLLLIAFVLSYGWSMTQPLRRGHRRRSAYLSMALLGAVLGAAVVDLGWALGGPALTVATAVVGLALGTLSFLALTRVIVMRGRRARLSRARTRREAAASN